MRPCPSNDMQTTSLPPLNKKNIKKSRIFFFFSKNLRNVLKQINFPILRSILWPCLMTLSEQHVKHRKTKFNGRRFVQTCILPLRLINTQNEMIRFDVHLPIKKMLQLHFMIWHYMSDSHYILYDMTAILWCDIILLHYFRTAIIWYYNHIIH